MLNDIVNKLVDKGFTAGSHHMRVKKAYKDITGEELTAEGYQDLKRALEAGPEYKIAGITKHDYIFTGTHYIFTVNGHLVPVERQRWEGIVAEYSAIGGDMTQYQVAQRHGIPKKDLEAMLRSYSHYKARPPVTREELKEALAEDNVDPLYNRSIEVAEFGFERKLTHKRQKHVEREYWKLKEELIARGDLREDVRDLLEEISDDYADAPPAPKKNTIHDEDYYPSAHITIFDTHLGLESHGEKGWTKTSNSDTTLQNIEDYISFAISKIEKRQGSVETLHLSMGGDIFHAINGQTLSGRPLQRDRPDRVMFRKTYDTLVPCVERLRRVANRVNICAVDEGNHDGFLAGLLIDQLGVYYRNAEDVHVDDAMHGGRAYFVEGETLHLLDHGTVFGNLGDGTLGTLERIARHVAGADYHRIRRIIVYIGHKHHREGRSQGHIEILRQPTLCYANDFEEFLGFINDPMADMYWLNDKGLIGDITRFRADDVVYLV